MFLILFYEHKADERGQDKIWDIKYLQFFCIMIDVNYPGHVFDNQILEAKKIKVILFSALLSHFSHVRPCAIP